MRTLKQPTGQWEQYVLRRVHFPGPISTISYSLHCRLCHEKWSRGDKEGMQRDLPLITKRHNMFIHNLPPINTNYMMLPLLGYKDPPQPVITCEECATTESELFALDNGWGKQYLPNGNAIWWCPRYVEEGSCA